MLASYWAAEIDSCTQRKRTGTMRSHRTKQFELKMETF
jgi:hypothetical protein